MSGFRITDSKGFQITFDNGWTVSVQFGPGNYCQNYNLPFQFPAPKEGYPSSATAEIAAWDDTGKWYEFDGDTVDGHKNVTDVLEFINMIAAMPEEGDTK